MKTVQINCLLEFSFEEGTREELIAKAIEALNNTSYREMGEMLQVDAPSEWCIINDDGSEEE